MKRICLCVVLALPLLTSCSTVAKVAESMGHTNAVSIADVGTPWGVQKLRVIGYQPGNSIEVFADGRIVITPTYSTNAALPK